ncbi:MAG: FMN-binding negative transcriptional regulator [Nitratireductor sp.]
MYIPPHFRQVDANEIAHLIEQFPLATIVCEKDGEFIANHIPLLCVGENKYVGHIAKENALHTVFPNGVNAIAIFSAQNTYISPNWYPSKQKTHRHVPTWNYQVVHLHGRIKFDHSKKACLAAVGKLTKTYEKIHSGDKAWKMSDAPKDFMDQMLENIVAFDFEVENIIAKSKISQNREKEDFDSVAQKMKEQNNNFLANSMSATKEKLNK